MLASLPARRATLGTRGEEIPIDVLQQLARLLAQERETLLARWRVAVRKLPSARHLDIPALNDHIPLLLDELEAALRHGSEESIAEALLEGSPPVHGLQRWMDSFQVEEVVAEYNILRGCIHDLAQEHGISLHGLPFHVLNRVLDGAIGSAVQAFATAQALEVQHRREEYLALVAHDLRTPLNAISLAARVLEMLLAEASARTPEAPRMWRALNRNVNQLEALVEKVLEEKVNLQTEAGVKIERRQFDLWPLVESLIHDLHPIAGTGSTRLTNGVPEELVLYADANLLRRVFQNLIANAIHYTPHGEILVAARVATENGSVECTVSDNGDGIPEERLPFIFDRHESDPERPGGLGLGLAIVKAFIEAHGGTVSVESARGRGSTFRFTLPGRGS